MISILNYGVGNVKSFANVFSRLNVPFNIINSKSDLLRANKILFPGVGSFDNAMNLFNNSGLRDTLEDLVVNKEIPILGVCVGMQMFAESSEEGQINGLGWLHAKVKKIQSNPSIIVPHMGWNNIERQNNHFIVNDLTNDSFFYFLHTYIFECFEIENIICNTNYGNSFNSIVCKKNIIGVQFHPEKSHNAGQILLHNFAKHNVC